MSEMGSFIELEYPSGREYYNGENTVRLNSGRAAIYHAVKSYGCRTVYLPFYQCETVKNFLESKNIEIKYYRLDENLVPQLDPNTDDSAVVIVNYFGLYGTLNKREVSRRYKNVIIDNSQAFFADPVEGCLNIYSARKFFGVPDGAYVIGTPYLFDKTMYADDFSSDTALFLLQRIEYGCEGKAYASRTQNEARIDKADIMNMSCLTRRLLDGIDYEAVKRKRTENFKLAELMLKKYNQMELTQFYDDTCVPMVYPLMLEKENLLDYLLSHKHFQGRWWKYLLSVMPCDAIEYRLSKYMIPITIDQRYGEAQIKELCSLIMEF